MQQMQYLAEFDVIEFMVSFIGFIRFPSLPSRFPFLRSLATQKTVFW